MSQQQDSHSCVVLALMAADAIVKNTSLDEVNVSGYVLQVHKGMHRQNSTNEYCAMPFCSDPKAKKIGWLQCDQCVHWCHRACVPMGRGRPVHFVYVICQCRE